MQKYSRYFHAYVKRSETWFFVATLRSFEYMAFDRTLDKTSGLFELFVPDEYMEIFTDFMDYHVRNGVVQSYEEKPNRLRYESV